jgi:ribosome-associated heat shock protein Hsp15
MPDRPAEPATKIRIDKWLWQARFFKTRGLAGDVASTGRLRINALRCEKAAQQVRPGDVLTFPQGKVIRVIRIEELGSRRGPASEAQALYTDLEPPPPREVRADSTETTPASGERDPGSGRPTKRARRELDTLRRFDP